MIIASAPFRISFAGGGSDLPIYYQQRRGAVLSTSINRHIYICIHPYFNRDQTLLKYSQNELIRNVADAAHPIFREVLKEICPEGGVEIVSTSDIPSGTGLGSSSSFTVALLHALYAHKETFCSKEKLAQKASEVEIDRLKEPIGKQDQYAAAYGGLNFIEFNSDESVTVSPVILPKNVITQLEKSLVLFYMGDQRETREILRDQVSQVSADGAKFDNMTKMVDLAYRMRDQLIAGDVDNFGRSLHTGWELKRSLSEKISNARIDSTYQRALKLGALGGKILGAGGGGFLLLYCPESRQPALRAAFSDFHELPFQFDWAGSRIIYVGDRTTEPGFVRTEQEKPREHITVR
jgi:D-glycero-alpha-D-manno-heptose-7-phosphate kinase